MNMISLKGLNVCLLFFCFQSAQGKCHRLNKTNEFIVGGHAAHRPIPYQASYDFFANNQWHIYCGGAIITQYHVLTAAHCIRHKTSDTTVLVGTNTYHQLNGYRYNVTWTKKHPRYNGTHHYFFNIGMLRIQGSFIWSINVVEPIAFHSAKPCPDNALVWVSGWGFVDNNQTFRPEVLQQVARRTMSNNYCKKLWGKRFNDDMMCTSGIRVAAPGDIGGPVVNDERNALVGIVSFTPQYGSHDVYTRVFSYIDWIENTIHEKCV